MILSNTAILDAIDMGDLVIDPIAGRDVSKSPFNTSAVDLRLGSTVTVPKRGDPVTLRLDRPYSSSYIERNCEQITTTENQPYNLEPNQFVLAQTLERVALPIRQDRPAYAARVEGKSSRARYGMLVHFTAPTVHSGFDGKITLEIINLGPNTIALTPRVFICQLIIEQLSGTPNDAPNQFFGQTRPAG